MSVTKWIPQRIKSALREDIPPKWAQSDCGCWAPQESVPRPLQIMTERGAVAVSDNEWPTGTAKSKPVFEDGEVVGRTYENWFDYDAWWEKRESQNI